MNSIKQYFSPPPVNDEEPSSDKPAVRISDEEIRQNMEDVLKSIKKKKRAKHKLKRQLERERESSSTSTTSTSRESTAPPAPMDDKENQRRPKVNAFQFMMNAQRRSIGSNSEATSYANSQESVGGDGEATKSAKRKRQQMLSEWAEAKGGRKRKEDEEAQEEYIQRQMDKRAKRLKNMLVNGKDGAEKVEKKDSGEVRRSTRERKVIKIVDESDEELTPKPVERKVDDFVKKLSSPTKKKESSLFGYFDRLKPAVEVKEEVPAGKKRGRPAKVKKISSPVKVQEKTPEKVEEVTLNGRPKRSCAQNASYKFDFDSPDAKPTRKSRSDASPELEIIELGENSSTPPKRKPNKLAPIFMKPVPKPSLDPEVVKARREFLQSGLPEHLRIEMERQKAYEDSILNDSPIFPLVSHVRQLDEAEMEEESPPHWGKFTLGAEIEDFALPKVTQWFLNRSQSEQEASLALPEISHRHSSDRKSVAHRYKESYGRFPVYKCLNRFIESVKSQTTEGSLFTEKYRPTSSEQIFINSASVGALKRFLSAWTEDQATLDSTDDFEDSTASSASQTTTNTVVLLGPPGSGKTTAVLALADEMNFNVLEVNAGSKRTGKKMLQELHEATQSHQLSRKEKEEQLKKARGSGRPSKNVSEPKESGKKISLILIEDADIVFEQDDGFVGALNQLAATSKRPVILTAIDPNCAHLAKFIASNCIRFFPAVPITAGRLLSVMALTERFEIADTEISRLYTASGLDLRRSILQLQFYVQSGGDLARDVASTASTTPTPPPHEAASETSNDSISLSFTEPRGRKSESYRHRGLFRFFTRDQNDDRALNRPISIDEVKWKATGNIKSAAQTLSALSTAAQLATRPIEDRLVGHLGEEIMMELLALNGLRQGEGGGRKPKNEPKSLFRSLNANVKPTRANYLDYEPYLRAICRSEKARLEKDLENGRRANRFYHHLRALNANSFSTEYFERFCQVLAD